MVLSIVFIQKLCLSQELFITTIGYENSKKTSVWDKKTTTDGRDYNNNNIDKNINISYLQSFKQNNFYRIILNVDDTYKKSTFNGFTSNNFRTVYIGSYKETFYGGILEIGKQYQIEKLIIRFSISTGYSIAFNTKYSSSFIDYHLDTIIAIDNSKGILAPRQLFSLSNSISFYYPIFKKLYIGLEIYNSINCYYQKGNNYEVIYQVGRNNQVIENRTEISNGKLINFQSKFLNPINIGIMFKLPNKKEKQIKSLDYSK